MTNLDGCAWPKCNDGRCNRFATWTRQLRGGGPILLGCDVHTKYRENAPDLPHAAEVRAFYAEQEREI